MRFWIIAVIIYVMIGLGAYVKVDSHPNGKDSPQFVKDLMVVLWPMSIGAILMDEAMERKSG